MVWAEFKRFSRGPPPQESWIGPDSKTAEPDLGWKEPFSQRFHKLSKPALDEIISTLLAAPVEHGVASEWTLTDGLMQRLCSAARCGPQRGWRTCCRVWDAFCGKSPACFAIMICHFGDTSTRVLACRCRGQHGGNSPEMT